MLEDQIESRIIEREDSLIFSMEDFHCRTKDLPTCRVA